MEHLEMPELIALMRLSIRRYQRLLLCMIGLIVIGLFCTLTCIQWFGQEVATTVGGYAIFFSLLPSGVAAIALFDYGLDQDLSQPETGCSHWLLRQPIRSWKIASVPIALKTTWVSALWITFSLLMRSFGQKEIPVIQPCISFSAVLIWIMVLSWRPFTKGRYLLLALFVALPTSYLVIASSFVAPFIENRWLAPIAVPASWIATILFFCSAVWCLLRATNLARVTPPGGNQPSETPTTSIPQSLAPSNASSRDSDSFTSWLIGNPHGKTSHLKIILWHDYLSLRHWTKQVYLIGVIPGTLLYGLITPFHIVSVIGLFFGVIYLAIIINSKHLIQDHADSRTSKTSNHLPTYLATKPIPSKIIAWGRLVVPLAMAVSTYSWILVVIGIWSLQSSNRTAWLEWSSSLALRLGNPESDFWIGIKISTAIILGVGILFFTRMMAHAWVAASGRTWVVITNSAYAITCVFLPLIVFLRWFLRQTDWETTQQSAMAMLQHLPRIIIALLTIKCFITITVIALSIKKRCINCRDVTLSLAAWISATVIFGFLFHQLIPHPVATWKNCCVVMILILPLARWLALPMTVAWNRHR
jgi:hypothetical protein